MKYRPRVVVVLAALMLAVARVASAQQEIITFYDFTWQIETQATMFNGIVQNGVEGSTFNNFTLTGRGPLRLDVVPSVNQTIYSFTDGKTAGGGLVQSTDNFTFTTGLTNAPGGGVHGLTSGHFQQMADVVGNPLSPDSFSLDLILAGGGRCAFAPTEPSGCNGFRSWSSELIGSAVRQTAQTAEPLTVALVAGGLVASRAMRHRWA